MATKLIKLISRENVTHWIPADEIAAIKKVDGAAGESLILKGGYVLSIADGTAGVLEELLTAGWNHTFSLADITTPEATATTMAPPKD